jgi:hypothetical protein
MKKFKKTDGWQWGRSTKGCKETKSIIASKD